MREHGSYEPSEEEKTLTPAQLYRKLTEAQRRLHQLERFQILHPDGSECPKKTGCTMCAFRLSEELELFPLCTLEDRRRALLYLNFKNTDLMVWCGEGDKLRTTGLFHCPAKRGYRMCLCILNAKDGKWRAVLVNARDARIRVSSSDYVDFPYSLLPRPDLRWNMTAEQETKSVDTFCDRYGENGTANTDWKEHLAKCSIAKPGSDATTPTDGIRRSGRVIERVRRNPVPPVHPSKKQRLDSSPERSSSPHPTVQFFFVFRR